MTKQVINFSDWESNDLNRLARRYKIDMRKMKDDLGIGGSYANFHNMLDGGTIISEYMYNKVIEYIRLNKSNLL